MEDLKVPEKKFRPELEGIRAVAAVLVAVYHIWIGSVSGGVDVFFIVSGYLITTSLLSRIEREGRINFTENLLGLAKRLFPLAFTVLLVSSVLSILLLPQAVWKETISELFASMFYFQNWQLANNTVDYLAQNNQASPFQHFWALSIQGQFYITWPIVITLVYLIAKKVLKTPIRKTLLISLILIFCASISYSIYITEVNQPWAYFDTFARAWEFSLGGILALLISYIVLKKSVSFILGWLGLAVIVFTGILLPVSNVFPGYVALLPTTGVMLVIISAENGSRFGVQKFLSSKPLLYFGSISYGFYLWHWPLLIFYYAYFDTDTISTPAGLAVLLITFVLSVVTIKLVEGPIRTINVKQSKGRLGKILVALTAPVILVGISWGMYVQASLDSGYATENYSESLSVPDNPQDDPVTETIIEDYPGARSISHNIKPADGKEPIPTPLQAKEENPIFYENKDCYARGDDSTVTKCSFGVTENPSYTIALVGGSHSGHWFPALREMSERLGLRIDVYNKDACRFTRDDFDGLLTEACMEWNDKLVEVLKEDLPDLIFTTANVNIGNKVPSGYLEIWREFEGITEIFAIRDNPRMKEEPPTCLEEHPDKCSVPRDKALAEVVPWENTENVPENVTFADMSEYFCDEETCYPVIGNVMVYRDLHHLTTLYSKTMGPALEEHITEALENLQND
ncbi:acyltransferase family protein [Metaplanococcus flavidus]|uniref:Acyltransferase family protein n=1 Tax=Metaplanococcus flavidus TaxID=569883 RepID=A0ABW3LCP3_9BACL